MDDRVGVGIIRVDAEGLRQPRAIAGLDRGEAKAMLHIARGDKADPARAEHADAVVKDHVVVRPRGRHTGICHLLSTVSSATSIRTIAWPVLTSAPSGSIHRSDVRIAAPTLQRSEGTML